MKFTFDQSTDKSGRELLWFSRDVPIPEFVKTAEVDDTSTLAILPKTAFADSARRVYPINTPARTFVSFLFFNEKKAEIKRRYGQWYSDKIEQKIKTAARVFDIENELTTITQSSQTKQADYVKKYVAEVVSEGHDPLAVYPYKTAQDLQYAGEQFVKDLNKYPVEWRIKIAEGFVEAAKDVGVSEFPDIIGKYAGLYFSTPGAVVTEIERRAKLLKSAENKAIYLGELRKIASEVDSVDNIRKIAEICDTVETQEKYQLNNKHASILGDPFDKFFDLDVEKVAQLIDVVEAAGEMYKLPELSKVSKDIYQQAFGIDIDPTDREKLADFMVTAPRSDMKMFRDLSGVKPLV